MDWVKIVTDPDERERRLAAARLEFEQEGTIVEASEAKGARDLILARAFAHPRDKRIRFVEDTHKYFLDGVALPISVTGFYGRYFSHFDADEVVGRNIGKWRTNSGDPRYAFLKAIERMGASQTAMESAIKYAWHLNGEHQSALGTALHRAIELTMNGQPIPEAQPVPDPPLEINLETPIGRAMHELRYVTCGNRLIVNSNITDEPDLPKLHRNAGPPSRSAIATFSACSSPSGSTKCPTLWRLRLRRRWLCSRPRLDPMWWSMVFLRDG